MAGLGGPAPYWHQYAYDDIGNRLTETRKATAGDTTYTYSHPASGASSVRPHAVTQVQMNAPGTSWTHGYTYDNAGNLATRLSDDGNQQTLTFDPEGRLASVAENGDTTSFLHDADGTRLIRRDPSGTTLYLPGGTEVRVPTGSATATATRYYSHNDTTVAVRTAAGLAWIVGDHHGTAEVTIAASSLAVSKRRSLPFGADRGPTGSGWPTAMDKGFVGGTKDPTGLTHLGARYYDPAIGRFISVDPKIDPGDPQQLHAYAYAANNPVTRADPTGQWPGWLDKAASATVNAVASAASTVGNTVVNTVVNTVEAIKEDPLKFAVGLAVGIAVTVAVAAVCATGVGCLIVAGAVAGAAAAGAEYGVDVAQGDKEFSWSDLGTEMAIGGAIGAATAGVGLAAGKAVNAARGAVTGGGRAAGLADDAATAGRRPPRGACLSFTPETPVLLASGAAIPIGSIQLGDHVLATDPISGTTTAEPVVTLYANIDIDLADVTIANPDGTTSTVHTTQNHPFWNATTRTWTPAANLRPGDQMATPTGGTVTVAGVITWTQSKLMLNLGVSDQHTYYVIVGGTPVLVHNAAIDDSFDPRFSRPGYRNYTLRDITGKIYYSGMHGTDASRTGVERRHGNNHDRFDKTKGDTLVYEDGSRTYGEARLREQELADKHKTWIGRDPDTWRGNRQNPMDAAKKAGYERYVQSLGGGACPTA